MQPAIFDEECMAAESGAVRENHARRIGIRDLDIGNDLVRTAPDADRDAFRNG
jgi:hypothetical protein